MTALDLRSAMFRLREDGAVLAEGRRTTPDLDGWTVLTLHVETAADAHPDVWEKHPDGDEVMCVLTGGARIYFRTAEGGPDGVLAARLSPGTACVIPRDQWHRVEIEGPSDIMAFTRIGGTRLEKRRGH